MWEIWSGHKTQAQTFDLQVWPWHCAKMADLGLIYTSSYWTKHLSQVSWQSFKRCQKFKEDTKCRLKHLTFNCDLTLSQDNWQMPCAHCLSKLNIWAKFHKHFLKNGEYMEQTRKTDSNTWSSSVTLAQWQTNTWREKHSHLAKYKVSCT